MANLKIESVGKKTRNKKHDLSKGVTYILKPDRNDRSYLGWQAAYTWKGKQKTRFFSINKYGSQTAKLLASLQRMMWLIEEGKWTPEDGDPFQNLFMMDLYKGNQEYENAVIDGVESPYIQSRKERES